MQIHSDCEITFDTQTENCSIVIIIIITQVTGQKVDLAVFDAEKKQESCQQRENNHQNFCRYCSYASLVLVNPSRV